MGCKYPCVMMLDSDLSVIINGSPMEIVMEEFPMGRSNPTALGTLGVSSWAYTNQGEITANKAIKIDLITNYSLATYNKLLNFHIKCKFCSNLSQNQHKNGLSGGLGTLDKEESRQGSCQAETEAKANI